MSFKKILQLELKANYSIKKPLYKTKNKTHSFSVKRPFLVNIN